MLSMCKWEVISYKEFLGGICCAGCGTLDQKTFLLDRCCSRMYLLT